MPEIIVGGADRDISDVSTNALDALGLTRDDIVALVKKRERRIAELEDEVRSWRDRYANAIGSTPE